MKREPVPRTKGSCLGSVSPVLFFAFSLTAGLGLVTVITMNSAKAILWACFTVKRGIGPPGTGEARWWSGPVGFGGKAA